jgi:hypothetical protein
MASLQSSSPVTGALCKKEPCHEYAEQLGQATNLAELGTLSWIRLAE